MPVCPWERHLTQTHSHCFKKFWFLNQNSGYIGWLTFGSTFTKVDIFISLEATKSQTDLKHQLLAVLLYGFCYYQTLVLEMNLEEIGAGGCGEWLY